MAEPNSKTSPPKAQELPTGRPLSNFLYKAIFVFVLIALLPLFPSSQSSPELENKTILSRSCELLHLLFVGIAISYGLFSRRNTEPDLEKEIQLKADTDTPQSSYVSQILQASSVFEEEFESPKVMDFPDDAKNQTWNYSQYYREKPAVMVAEESTNGVTSSSAKPLFLRVRSLKSDSSYETDNKATENGGKEGTVLPSPIPWRSRSGRMEVNSSLPNSASFDTETPLPQIPSFRSSTPLSTSTTTPSPRILPPLSSLSMNADLGRKKSLSSKSSPPPPPAPPPPPLPPKHASHFSVEKRRDATKSFKDELEGLSRGGKGVVLHTNDLSSSGSFKSEKASCIGRSVRTVGTRETQSLPPLPRNQGEKKNGFVDKITVSDSASDDDDEEGDDSEISDVEEESKQAPTPEENEVDKKADEFIAKFREQIRLQRIESIKKSSGQRAKINLN